MLKKLFGYDATQTTVKTEIVAGVTTFLTMSYILAVNPSMFSQIEGMPGGAVFTSTALAAIIGCLAMAFIGKLPFGLAPGMGLNAFFVFSVCLGMGYSWQFALTAVFIEGLIFILLTLTNVREAIVKAIPMSLRNAIGAGIGLFIAFIGLASAGVVVPDEATLVTLGDITSGSALLAIIGLIITGFMYVKKVPGAILIGIIATMIIGIPMVVTEFKGIMSKPESIAPIFCQFEWDQVFTLDMLVVVFTFLFIDKINRHRHEGAVLFQSFFDLIGRQEFFPFFSDVHNHSGTVCTDFIILNIIGSDIEFAVAVAAPVYGRGAGIGTGHHFLRSIGGEGINAGQILNHHILAAFQLTLFLLHRHAGPVTHILVGPGQQIK